ncbi:MAG: hypothetical protein PHR47_00480 [Candidatus Pacebacteria bacterium]|nr:hypothetical protein [Candidatus Paceibacterota bacterium]
MENLPFKIDNNDYVKLPRSLKTAYLDGLLKFEDYTVLIWLWINANPRNGKTHVSYAGLSKDFKEKFSKNFINQIMLRLKRQKWIWYPRQQGHRSSFNVDIASYPLSDGTFKDIEFRFLEKFDRSENGSDSLPPTVVPTEVETVQQKLKDGKKLLAERFSFNPDSSPDRSSKNETEKENENNRSKGRGRRPVRSFTPKSYAEQRCWEIAKDLGEADMTFILSAVKKYGLLRIEDVYLAVMEQPSEKVKNKGAYFNRLLSL